MNGTETIDDRIIYEAVCPDCAKTCTCLVDQGTRGERKRIEFVCSCGRVFHEDPRALGEIRKAEESWRRAVLGALDRIGDALEGICDAR